MKLLIAVVILSAFVLQAAAQEPLDLSYLHTLPEDECRAIMIFAIHELLGSVYDLQTELAAVREEQAEQRGRSNAQTGVAAGIPSTIGAVIIYILRRNGRKKKETP